MERHSKIPNIKQLFTEVEVASGVCYGLPVRLIVITCARTDATNVFEVNLHVVRVCS